MRLGADLLTIFVLYLDIFCIYYYYMSDKFKKEVIPIPNEEPPDENPEPQPEPEPKKKRDKLDVII